MEKQFFDACIEGRIYFAKELIKHIDPSIEDNRALRYSTVKGQVEIVEMLLSDPRVDPSAMDNQAIKWAAYYGHLEICKLLLSDPRVDPSTGDNLAIRFAVETEHLQVVKELLSDERVSANQVFKFACANDYIETVNLILSVRRINQFIVDKSIELAKHFNHLEIVDLLTRYQYELDNSKYNDLSKFASLCL